MSQLNTQRLRQFASDPVMEQAVFDHYLNVFMKRRQGGVEEKAAQMIAIELLHDARAEMMRYKSNESEERRQTQTAL